MDVPLLGPVELHVAGEVVPLAGGRARALVAILALRRGTTVGREVIADALWGTEPPLTADKQVQILVSRVRRVLAERGEGDRIVTRPGGYALRVEASEVDVAQVEVLV